MSKEGLEVEAHGAGAPPGPIGLLRNLVVLSSGEVVSKVVGFVTFAYLARVLGADSYGALELAVSLSVFFALLTDAGLTHIGARQVARDPAAVPHLTLRIPALRTLMAAIAIPAMGLVGLVLSGSEDHRTLIWLFALSMIPLAWTQKWLFQGLENMGVVALGQVIRMTLFAFAVLLLIRGPEDLLVAGWAEIGATLSVALLFLAVQYTRLGAPRRSSAPGLVRGLLLESIPLGLSQLAGSTGRHLPIVLVAALHTTEDTAWFGAAHRISFSLATFVWVYHFNLLPAISRRLADSAASVDGLFGPSIRATTWGGVAVASGITFGAGPISRIVFGSGFSNAAPALSILAWTFPTALLFGHARSMLIAERRHRELLIAQLCGVLGTLAVGLALVPSHGAVGAAIAALIGSVVLWVIARAFAIRLVAPLPDMGSLVRSGVTAFIASVAIWILGLSAWWGASAAVLAILMAAALADRRFVSDGKTLLAALRAPR